MMKLAKLVVGIAGVASLLGAVPTYAAMPETPCTAREGQSGTWRTDTEGKWLRCRQVGMPAATGGGLSTALKVAAPAALFGLAIALASGNRKSASP